MTSPGPAVSTGRLALTRLAQADLHDVYRVFSDPETWRHLPSGRHTRLEQSQVVIDDAASSWAAHELGAWAIRSAGPDRGGILPAHRFLGTGGVNMTPASVWNLGYRLAPETWGRGFATEIALAAVEAATSQAPVCPVTARVMSNNPASAAVAQRAGLDLIWEGPSQALVKRGTWGQIYANGEVSETALEWLIAHV